MKDAVHRRRLPRERESVVHKFKICSFTGYIRVGHFEDGEPGEIFITLSKKGSTVSGLVRSIAILTSIALQHGVPLDTLVSKFVDMSFEPSGITDNPNIPNAKSIVDYVFRWMDIKYNKKEKK